MFFFASFGGRWIEGVEELLGRGEVDVDSRWDFHKFACSRVTDAFFLSAGFFEVAEFSEGNTVTFL